VIAGKVLTVLVERLASKKNASESERALEEKSSKKDSAVEKKKAQDTR